MAVAVGLALTAGSAVAASAHGGRGPGGNLDGVLTGLKDKGTLTQSQIDAIKKALEDQRISQQAARVAEETEFQKLITTTVGLDSTTITTRLKAGESLGAIAGAKRQALIDALIAFHTKKIEQGVTDGKLTAAQATTLKAGLSASVTFFVDRVPGSLGGRGRGPGFDHPGMGPGGDDHMGKGRGHGGMKGQKGKGKSSSTSNTGYNA